MFEDDEVQAEQEATRISEPVAPGLWSRFRAAFSVEERWSSLNWAIAAYPDAPTNFLLRGELLLARGDIHGAIMDFRRALELATAAVERDDWGVVAQTTQDRALTGLRDALRRAGRYNLETEDTDSP